MKFRSSKQRPYVSPTGLRPPSSDTPKLNLPSLQTLAIESGAEEIDMVINIGKLKDKDYHYVHKDIAHVVKAAHNDRQHKKHTVKVIFETCLLTREEIVDAAILCVYSGADFVKTSTGFSKAGAKAEDVRMMKLTVGSAASVKASGGVRTYADAISMIQNGASRIGSSDMTEASRPSLTVRSCARFFHSRYKCWH
jgi:deoxyribose-phosphate aldolase